MILTADNFAMVLGRMLHRGQKYGGTHDYFETHVCDVAGRVLAMEGADYVCVDIAYLHDVLEDTVATEQDLRDLGMSNRIVEAVVALTRRDGEDYMDFIRRCKVNQDARLVKICDLKANLAALGGPPERLRVRYQLALSRLED